MNTDTSPDPSPDTSPNPSKGGEIKKDITTSRHLDN